MKLSNELNDLHEAMELINSSDIIQRQIPIFQEPRLEDKCTDSTKCWFLDYFDGPLILST